MSKKHKRQKRKMTHHHLIPKSRGGKSREYNLFTLDWERHHKPWHDLFANRTPEEILEYLIRYFWGGYIPQQMKGVANGTPMVHLHRLV